MNKTIIVIITIVLVALGVGVYLVFANTSVEEAKVSQGSGLDSVVELNDEIQKPSSPEIQTSENRYIVYDTGVLEEFADNEKVLFFYANWCPTCRPVDTELQANQASIPDGVTIIRVNYNDTETDSDEEDLADQYGVTYQHTFALIDADGNEITKWNGGGLDEIIDRISK